MNFGQKKLCVTLRKTLRHSAVENGTVNRFDPLPTIPIFSSSPAFRHPVKVSGERAQAPEQAGEQEPQEPVRRRSAAVHRTS